MKIGVRPNFFELIGVIVVVIGVMACLAFTVFLWLGYFLGDARDAKLRVTNADLTDCRAKLAKGEE